MNLHEVLDAAGIDWPQRGRKIACPFHFDRTPSLHLYDDEYDGHWYCFSCGKHGLPGDLYFEYMGRYPDRVGGDKLFRRTEATAGLSPYAIKMEVVERRRAIGGRLSRAAYDTLPADVLPTWLLYVAAIEADVEEELKELAPFDANKVLDRWERLAEYIGWQFVGVCDSLTECTITSNHSQLVSGP